MEENYMNHYHQACPYISFQDSFPQFSNGNFMFNGKYQADFDSFLQSLTDSPRRNYVSDEEDNFSDEEDGVSDEEDGVSDEEDGVSDEEDGVSDEEDGVSEEEDGVSDQEDGVSDQEDGVSDEEENVLDEDDNTSDEEDNVSDEKRLGTGDINLVDRKQSSFEVQPLESEEIQKFHKFTLDQKPILNEFTLPYDDMETTRTTAEAQAAWVSTLSQINLKSGRTLPPSDYPQQYVGNTSDTVCQLSQTYAEGSSGLSRPLKRKAPSTQSRVPQDDPEIPEKQSKTITGDAPKLFAYLFEPQPKAKKEGEDPGQGSTFTAANLIDAILTRSINQPTGEDIEAVYEASPRGGSGSSDKSASNHGSESMSMRGEGSPVPSSSTNEEQRKVPEPPTLIADSAVRINLESDGILNKLSKHMPPRSYATLCTHLGIGYDQADAILAKFNMDYQRATRDCLAQWKTRTGGNMAQLKTILQDAEVGDLVKYI
ncbi:uncharacterized protein LOC105443178 isoform X1 [Strongylocentrotus purpuratus]|uniref:Death domain-containing protein n=1 Tax=Strongylocentrotus purpuratus TaxID=7668 RepID=A0A7M7NEK1_STRPU|nr:uncharacterized protein LOC105443178 isoform X1 [Strongylocentrotus purpuratus]